MPKKSKRVSQAKQNKGANAGLASNDYEEYLFAKIDRCQRIVDGLSNNDIWKEIKEDYEKTSSSLDSVWAFEDISTPRFRQMQVTKMAASTFLNLLPNYEHDLKLAKTELARFKNPQGEVKKDFDDEGIQGKPIPKSDSNQYHG